MSSAAVAGTAAADGDVANNDSKYSVPWVALYDSFQQKNVYVLSTYVLPVQVNKTKYE